MAKAVPVAFDVDPLGGIPGDPAAVAATIVAIMNARSTAGWTYVTTINMGNYPLYPYILWSK